MAPGVDPPYRAAAAWPNSWNPADSTVTAKTSNKKPGLWNASYAADARPLSKSSHQHRYTNAATKPTTGSGPNSRANGRVIRSVRRLSVTTYLNRSASSGFDLRTCG